MVYTLLVFTDNQAGKHKDRRKNSIDAKAVSSRTSEGEWQTDCVGLEHRTPDPRALFPGDHKKSRLRNSAPHHPPHRSALSF